MRKLRHKRTVTVTDATTYQLTSSVRARVTTTNEDPDSATISFYLKKKPELLKSESAGYIELGYIKNKEEFHRTIKERVTFHDSKQLVEKFHNDVICFDDQINSNKEVDQLITQWAKNPPTDDDFAICYRYDHTWRNVQGERLEQCVSFDYINGFKQSGQRHTHPNIELSYLDEYEWEPLKQYLMNHPRIVNFKCEKIPYYNSEFNGQEGLSFKVVIDPKWEGLDSLFGRWIHTHDHLGTHRFKKQ